MAKSIPDLVNALPKRSVTVYVLRGLDFVVPGQWENIIDFEEMTRKVTGETDPNLIRSVIRRADALYSERGERYQRAMKMYRLVDTTDRLLATAALADKIGEKVRFLHFLTRLTPKADRAQTIDFSMKLVVELLAFCQVNGIPGDSVGDFVKALADYSKESLMRMAALVCLDGLMPLGPDFSRTIMTTLDSLTPDELEKNRTFGEIKSAIPGNDTTNKLAFVLKSVDSVRTWIDQFVTQRGLTAENVTANIQNFIEVTDDRLDYWSAFIDMTTNYYTHTGTQSIGRRIIERAVNEI